MTSLAIIGMSVSWFIAGFACAVLAVMWVIMK